MNNNKINHPTYLIIASLRGVLGLPCLVANIGVDLAVRGGTNLPISLAMTLEPGDLLEMLMGLGGTILIGKWTEILPLEFEKKKLFFFPMQRYFLSN